jgi:hypothetical protein
MEVEMILRLRQRYRLVDLGEMVNHDFYHLEHRNPRVRTARQQLGLQANEFEANNLDPNAPAIPFHPNSTGWGLAQIPLATTPGLETAWHRKSWHDYLLFAALIADTGLKLMWDNILRLLGVRKKPPMVGTPTVR